jgi:hypothetical protein
MCESKLKQQQQQQYRHNRIVEDASSQSALHRLAGPNFSEVHSQQIMMCFTDMAYRLQLICCPLHGHEGILSVFMSVFISADVFASVLQHN